MRLAGATAAIVAAGVSTAGAAGPTASLREQAHSLAARTQQALLGLYSLDTRLHTAQVRLSALEAQAAHLRSEEAQLTQQLAATRRTLVISQTRLGDRISMLYKEGDVSALAVVLGSQSLDDAVTRLDDLNRVADQSRQVIDVAAKANSRVTALRAGLSARRRALQGAVLEARRTAASLEAARADRLRFIAGLRRAESLKAAQIAALERAARRVERKSDALQAAAVSSENAPAPVSAPVTASVSAPVVSAGRTITVSSTGYSIGGRTSTGMPTGWGVVAVDPAVIPLGTRLTIPGYGDGVASDTGGGVRGSSIDLWFPSPAQARAWGRRTVTIMLH